ncbi:hypothetical protein [Paraburkholderia caledonica]|jgi:hypothetical protein|uniref:hypothetical protein n=1 Tax=Paraburkholderia caledonica TaxID=134536 RepID=UPI0038B93E59
MKTAEIDAARLRKKKSAHIHVKLTSRADTLFGTCSNAARGIRHSAQFATSGTITRDKKFVEASGVAGLFDAGQDAEEAGLARARAWIDSHR